MSSGAHRKIEDAAQPCHSKWRCFFFLAGFQIEIDAAVRYCRIPLEQLAILQGFPCQAITRQEKRGDRGVTLGSTARADAPLSSPD